mmetsp:Transcript_81419/g.217756  ORF Transcript_81419/g.217756 Transcript_81419/m.217756 type:complete len:405 (+) Transcript_81419:973-2187(+)
MVRASALEARLCRPATRAMVRLRLLAFWVNWRFLHAFFSFLIFLCTRASLALLHFRPLANRARRALYMLTRRRRRFCRDRTIFAWRFRALQRFLAPEICNFKTPRAFFKEEIFFLIFPTCPAALLSLPAWLFTDAIFLIRASNLIMVFLTFRRFFMLLRKRSKPTLAARVFFLLYRSSPAAILDFRANTRSFAAFASKVFLAFPFFLRAWSILRLAWPFARLARADITRAWYFMLRMGPPAPTAESMAPCMPALRHRRIFRALAAPFSPFLATAQKAFTRAAVAFLLKNAFSLFSPHMKFPVFMQLPLLYKAVKACLYDFQTSLTDGTAATATSMFFMTRSAWSPVFLKIVFILFNTLFVTLVMRCMGVSLRAPTASSATAWVVLPTGVSTPWRRALSSALNRL